MRIDIPVEAVADAGQTLAQAGVSIVSTVPIDIPSIPIPLFHEMGINVSLLNDSIYGSLGPIKPKVRALQS
ncbi:hypothetical protein IOC57_06005 [Bacillus sp. SD075]|uniref:hypothetical protein n=1 Tax=Bacillus sp. SD075 TaxID=2781732 RepID=UPI001A95936F|nr:hypothetical protein [Bacillus sp. SD075]MBO0997310.1 hypothetical protein [Bacillus sp. SD075]